MHCSTQVAPSLARVINRHVLIVLSRVLVQPGRGLFQPFELVILRNVHERLKQRLELLAAITRAVLSRARAACNAQPI